MVSVRVRVRVRVRPGFGFGFGIGFGLGLATYGLRGLRAAVHRLVADYHPLSPLLACVRGRDRYTGEGRPRGAISGGPCPLVIIPYARSQHERRGPGGALGSAGRICGGRPHRCGRGGAALFQPAHLELPQLRVWAPVPPHHARAGGDAVAQQRDAPVRHHARRVVPGSGLRVRVRVLGLGLGVRG